jgi:hypothetical protein
VTHHENAPTKKLLSTATCSVVVPANVDQTSFFKGINSLYFFNIRQVDFQDPDAVTLHALLSCSTRTAEELANKLLPQTYVHSPYCLRVLSVRCCTHFLVFALIAHLFSPSLLNCVNTILFLKLQA